MALKTFVKVGSITNLSDARYCAGMGADMLGFSVMEGQESFISPKQFQEIRGWVTGPLVVAEIYGITNSESLAAILENYRPDFLELGIAELNLLKTLPLPFILFLKPGETASGSPDYILTDKDASRKEIASSKRLVLTQSGGDVNAILSQSDVFGIALKGGTELRPGLKEYGDLSEVFDLLESDD